MLMALPIAKPSAMPEHAPEEAHSSGLGEEQLLHVAIAGANGFHHSNFAAALQYRHDEGVDNGERGHGKRKRAEDSQEQIQYGEKTPQAFGGVEHRERAEAHLVDGVLHALDLGRIFNPHGQRHIGLAAGPAQRTTHVA